MRVSRIDTVGGIEARRIAADHRSAIGRVPAGPGFYVHPGRTPKGRTSCPLRRHVRDPDSETRRVSPSTGLYLGNIGVPTRAFRWDWAVSSCPPRRVCRTSWRASTAGTAATATRPVPPGTGPCTMSSDCESAHCADGVCCDSACTASSSAATYPISSASASPWPHRPRPCRCRARWSPEPCCSA